MLVVDYSIELKQAKKDVFFFLLKYNKITDSVCLIIFGLVYLTHLQIFIYVPKKYNSNYQFKLQV